MEDIIAKIQKLMALGDNGRNPSEEEAAQAMAMARKLLLKYGLSMEQVQGAGKQEDKFTQSPSQFEWKCWPRFASIVGAAVREMTFTRYFFSEHTGARRKDFKIYKVFFVGAPTDAAVAANLFGYLVQAILKMAWDAKKNDPSLSETDYQRGAAERIFQRAKSYIRQQEATVTKEESNQTTALVLKKETAVEAFFNALCQKEGMGTHRSRNTPIRDGRAFNMGFAAAGGLDMGGRRHLS